MFFLENYQTSKLNQASTRKQFLEIYIEIRAERKSSLLLKQQVILLVSSSKSSIRQCYSYKQCQIFLMFNIFKLRVLFKLTSLQQKYVYCNLAQFCNTLSLITVSRGLAESGALLIAHISEDPRVCQMGGKSDNQLLSMDYTTSKVFLKQVLLNNLFLMNKTPW